MWQELGMYVYQPGAIQIQQNNRILQQNFGRTNTQRTNGVSIPQHPLKMVGMQAAKSWGCSPLPFSSNRTTAKSYGFCCDSPSTKQNHRKKNMGDLTEHKKPSHASPKWLLKSAPVLSGSAIWGHHVGSQKCHDAGDGKTPFCCRCVMCCCKK